VAGVGGRAARQAHTVVEETLAAVEPLGPLLPHDRRVVVAEGPQEVRLHHGRFGEPRQLVGPDQTRVLDPVTRRGARVVALRLLQGVEGDVHRAGDAGDGYAATGRTASAATISCTRSGSRPASSAVW
jgi:hypothetical protein